MGVRAARESEWCSHPRRAEALVSLWPGWCEWEWCDGAMVCGWLVGWLVFRSAPTGHGIPAQGETLGTRHTQPMRSEGTPHRHTDTETGSAELHSAMPQCRLAA
jgi:hypothetical protein